MKKYITLLLFGLLLASFSGISQNEEIEKIDPSFGITYSKLGDGTKVLKSVAKYRKDRVWTKIEGLEVSFFNVVDGEENLLGTSTTDNSGEAKFEITPDEAVIAGEDGLILYLARTTENNLFESTEEEVEIKDLFLNMSLEVEDEVNMATVEAYTINADGEKEAMSDEDIFFFVPRMFTDLPVGEGYLEEGKASIEFPTGLIGDNEGNLKVIARLVEHDEFGTVEISQESSWGLPKSNHLQQNPSRELWTPIAPLWMIITLIVLLAGVWGHYFYTVVQLILIRREGKKLEAN